MLIHEVTHTGLKPLNIQDSVQTALNTLHLHAATRYPVADGDHLTGMISLEELLRATEEQQPIAELVLDTPVELRHEQHVLEAARLFAAHETRFIPVTDENRKVSGMVDKETVQDALYTIFNLNTPGSVIIIEIHPYDYTLSEIVRLIENEGARIMGIGSQLPDGDHQYFRVSVKLDVTDSSAVAAVLQRFGYIITSQFSSATLESDISERADELIRYLDI
jgi:predicted transcriptional regulator